VSLSRAACGTRDTAAGIRDGRLKLQDGIIKFQGHPPLADAPLFCLRADRQVFLAMGGLRGEGRAGLRGMVKTISPSLNRYNYL